MSSNMLKLYQSNAKVPFVAGGRFSVADITAIVTVDFATKAINLPIPEAHAALKRPSTNVPPVCAPDGISAVA